MEFLRTATQASHFGYPIIVFYLVGLIGLFLVIFRPYKAFLFSAFCLTARNYHAAVLTRTELLGPYLNLNDLLLWIALFAMGRECLRRKRIWAPAILLAIFGLILIGDFQSLFKYGIEEIAIRRIWSTAIFPIMFLIAANMVINIERSRHFFWTIFFGNVVAAISHMYYIHYRTAFEAYIGLNKIRIVSYVMGSGGAILIGALFAPSDPKLGRLKKWIYYIGMILIGLSLVLNFTRTLWISVAIVIILLPLIIWKQIAFSRIGMKLALLIGGGIIVTFILFPTLELNEMITERIQSFIYKKTFVEAYQARWVGSKAEIDIWLNSSLILGEGSCLPAEFERRDKFQTIKAYHVGYSAYLAHYGLVGLLTYLIFLPVLTVEIGRRYYLEHSHDYGGKIAIIAIAATMINAVGFLSSSHYLSPTVHIPGLLFGAVWSLYRRRHSQNSAV